MQEIMIYLDNWEELELAHGSRYRVEFKRRKAGVTDYRSRLRLIESEKPRIVVRITNNHISAQIIVINPLGDLTLVSAHSSELKKIGWLGNCKNVSAAYLTGFLCGKRALKNKIDESILDIGLKSSKKGVKVFSVLKGVLDAGLLVPHNEIVLPADNRIKGEHVAEYAKNLNEEQLNKKFSHYIDKGLQPKDLPKHFEVIKQKISENGVS
jgi:large subunit ribosomal protein L18